MRQMDVDQLREWKAFYRLEQTVMAEMQATDELETEVDRKFAKRKAAAGMR